MTLADRIEALANEQALIEDRIAAAPRYDLASKVR